MNLTLLTNGPLGWIAPALLAVAAFFLFGQLLRGNLRASLGPTIALAVVGVLVFVGYSAYAGNQDNQTFKDAIQKRYGVLVSDSQLATLRVDHSYRRYAPDITVQSTQGEADPYGTITLRQREASRRVMLYEVGGKWYLGYVPSANAADQEVKELPVRSGSIPSIN